jgi:hypothetical protein
MLVLSFRRRVAGLIEVDRAIATDFGWVQTGFEKNIGGRINPPPFAALIGVEPRIVNVRSVKMQVSGTFDRIAYRNFPAVCELICPFSLNRASLAGIPAQIDDLQDHRTILGGR